MRTQFNPPVTNDSKNSTIYSIKSTEATTNDYIKRLAPYLPKLNQTLNNELPENLSKVYLDKRNKDFASRYGVESKQKQVFLWGSDKSRANEDQVRKIEQSRISRRRQRAETPNSFVSVPESLESLNGKIFHFEGPKEENANEKNLDQSQINKVIKLRKMHAAILDVGIEGLQKKKTKNEFSLSMYKNYDTHSERFKVMRPNTSRSGQIEEVFAAKTKLASRNIICPIKDLIEALILPEDSLRPLSPDTLPRGGEHLIANPYIKLGKKKKGKKKSKKRKS